MCALCSDAIFLIQVSDFSGQVSDIPTELVVPEAQEEKCYSVCVIRKYQLKYGILMFL